MRGNTCLVPVEENPRAWSLHRCPSFWHSDLTPSSTNVFDCVPSYPGVHAACWRQMDMPGWTILNRLKWTANFLPAGPVFWRTWGVRGSSGSRTSMKLCMSAVVSRQVLGSVQFSSALGTLVWVIGNYWGQNLILCEKVICSLGKKKHLSNVELSIFYSWWSHPKSLTVWFRKRCLKNTEWMNMGDRELSFSTLPQDYGDTAPIGSQHHLNPWSC